MPNDDWGKSPGRQLLLHDIAEGKLDDWKPERVWEEYHQRPEFTGLERYDKQVFKSRLRSLRNSVKNTKEKGEQAIERAQRDAILVAHDRGLNPYGDFNSRGRPVIHRSETLSLLRQDLADGLYVKGLPMDLYNMRPEYGRDFTPSEFRKRIQQEILTNKWYKSKRCKWGDEYGLLGDI